MTDSKFLTIPTKPEPRTRWYGFRVTESEYQAICNLAQKLGVSASLLGRDLIKQTIQQIQADLSSENTTRTNDDDHN